MELRKATRKGVRPLIGVFAESGCGKTYTALMLARGFVGPTGRIGMIDTESGRGELYADVVTGGYDVLPLSEPFSPQRYVEAIQTIEKSGVAIGIIDSASHEWEGIGGVLDMAAAIEEKSGKPGLHCWKTPKLEHAKFMLKLLQSPIPWIVCLRAKFKSRQVMKPIRPPQHPEENVPCKSSIVKDEFTSPIQAEDFIYEMTVHGEVMPNHNFRITKCSHPDLRKCFPDAPLNYDHGKLLRQWCDCGVVQGGVSFKKQAWEMFIATHPGQTPEQFRAWLVSKTILGETEKLAEVTEDQWQFILNQMKNV